MKRNFILSLTNHTEYDIIFRKCKLYATLKFNIRPATIRDRMKRWNCDIKTALEAPLKNSEGYPQFLINIKKKFRKK